jgi:hypothetical protein
MMQMTRNDSYLLALTVDAYAIRHGLSYDDALDAVYRSPVMDILSREFTTLNTYAPSVLAALIDEFADGSGTVAVQQNPTAR